MTCQALRRKHNASANIRRKKGPSWAPFAVSPIKLSFYEFQVDMKADIVADDQAAGLGHAVPGKTKFLPVDLAVDADPRAGISPGILDDPAEFGIQLDIPGHVADG